MKNNFPKTHRAFLAGLTILSVILTSCANPLGSKTVSQPAIGDKGGRGDGGGGGGDNGDGGDGSGGGGDGGITNPATCDAVFFIPQLRLPLSSSIDSDTVTLSGCTEPVLISVSGDGNPRLSKNGAEVAGSTSVFTGDTLRIQLTTSAVDNTNHRATVAIGANQAVFSVTTGDFIPTSFLFSPATGQELAAQITSEPATLAGFDGSLTASVSGEGSPVILINGSVVGPTASVVAGNAISLRLTSSASENTTHSATVTINGISANFDVTTTGDATAPSITSISAPPNGSYKESSALNFTANFTENVVVVGSPRIILNIGGSTKYAGYISGSGTASLVFRYVIEAGVNDLNGIGIGSVQLNGATIRDVTGNAADLSFGVPDTAGIFIDTTQPSVVSASGPDANFYFPGQNLNFALHFTEPIQVTGTPRLTLTVGSTTRYANYLSGAGTQAVNFRYTVQSGDFDSNGITVAPSLDWNGGSLLDSAGNTALLSFSVPDTTNVKTTQCPTGFIPVPPLNPYTTSLFCVAKYEMKKVNNVATSQAAELPWVNISRNTSITTCSSLGAGYDLISNAQWQTIARNIESVTFNWSTATDAFPDGINRGHSDSSPLNAIAAAADENDACSETGQTCDLLTWHDQRRVHQLSNGSYIWDFSGNISEWIKDSYSKAFGVDSYISLISAATYTVEDEIGGVNGNANYHFGPLGNYLTAPSPTYAGLGTALLNYTAGAISRGGGWRGGGIYQTDLRHLGSTVGIGNGFRCVWSP